jgi:hypothetical protein
LRRSGETGGEKPSLRSRTVQHVDLLTWNPPASRAIGRSNFPRVVDSFSVSGLAPDGSPWPSSIPRNGSCDPAGRWSSARVLIIPAFPPCVSLIFQSNTNRTKKNRDREFFSRYSSLSSQMNGTFGKICHANEILVCNFFFFFSK